MKKIIFVVVLLLSLQSAMYAFNTPVKELWEQANNHYIKGDYQGAIKDYHQIIEEGHVSGKLYYNLANAYFKDGKLGLSILNYNKALLLTPYDKDAKHNLAVANSYIKDKIDDMPEFPVLRWGHEFRSLLGTNIWAVLSLVFLVVFCCGGLLFLLSERGTKRRIGFFSALGFVILFSMSVVFAGANKREIITPKSGVILSQAVSVKSAPNGVGSDIFIIHEGTKVDVISSYDAWCEIMIADGNKGWIPCSDIEMISI